MRETNSDAVCCGAYFEQIVVGMLLKFLPIDRGAGSLNWFVILNFEARALHESAWRIDCSAAPRCWTITEQRYGRATENSHACRECFRFVSSGSVGRQTDLLDQALIGLSILGELPGELLGRLLHGLDALFE